MKKSIRILLVAILSIMICCYAYAENDCDIEENRYSQTRQIYAGLSISSGVACCTGKVSPNSTQSCSLTMILFKKDGPLWIIVDSWTANASGGQTAYLCRYVSVSNGTYKVFCIGNVAGELTNVTSNIVTW